MTDIWNGDCNPITIGYHITSQTAKYAERQERHDGIKRIIMKITWENIVK